MSPAELALARAAAPAPAVRPVPLPAPRRPAVDLNALVSDLHARHGQELLGFCRWMLKDADEAADAMQDTWIRAMTALGDNLRVAALRPWLYAIARNVCLDRLRDRKRQSLQQLDIDDGGSSPSADHVVEVRQEAAAALALVASLSERQRKALLMREVAGMDVADIAKALGVTPERAAWTITDARRAVEEARAGSTIGCADVRARLGAGRRGRSLRAHLEECGECRAHDAKLRVRRVLAPALAPFLWLRRMSLPLLTKPAAAAVVAGFAAASLPIAAHHAPVRAAIQSPPAVGGTVSVRAVAASATAAPTVHRPQLRSSETPRYGRERPARIPAHAPAAQLPAAPPASTPAPSERPMRRPVGPSRPAPSAIVHRATASAVARVHSTLRAVDHTAARVPAVAPVVDKAVDTVDAIVGVLG
jgi:RNA polymerase sigma factor (sigma-70 family)